MFKFYFRTPFTKEVFESNSTTLESAKNDFNVYVNNRFSNTK